MHSRWTVLVAALVLASPALAQQPKLVDQGGSDPRLKGYSAPEGVKVEIIAEAPTVVNPIGLAFADDGTPLVLDSRPSPGDEGQQDAESITYRDGTRRSLTFPKKRVKDVVKILRDTKGKGTFDEARTILEDTQPSGLAYHDGWLYLAGRGTVRRYKPSKRGGAYDTREEIARGLASPISGLAIGLDGWLYLSAGPGDHHVEGSDGSQALALRTAAVFRCRPDGSRLHLYAAGLRQGSRQLAFSPSGGLFLGGLTAMADGAELGWRLPPNAGPPASHPISSTGPCFYDETRFPEPFRELFYFPDPEKGEVRAFRARSAGASFETAEALVFFKSGDRQFRPCQVVSGPDGAIYVVDWRGGDGKSGRIYRLTWSGTQETPAIAVRELDSWAKLARRTEAELLESLASPDGSIRQKARELLIRRGEKARAGLLKLLANEEQPAVARMAALWALEGLWNGDVVKALVELLGNSDADLRRLALEVLGLRGQGKGTEVVARLEDNHPAVRRAAALALARTGAAGSAEILVNALLSEEGKDATLFDGLVRAVEMTGQLGIDALYSQAESGDEKKFNRVIDIFTRLRSRAAAERLPALLKNPHLTVKQRTALVRTYRNFYLDPPVNLGPLVEWLVKNSDEALEVKRAGVEILTANQAIPRQRASGWVAATLEAAGLLWIGRPLDNPRVRSWLLKLLEDEDQELRLATLRAVEAGQVKEAEGRLLRLLRTGEPEKSLRVAALRALAAVNRQKAEKIAGSAQALEAILKSARNGDRNK